MTESFEMTLYGCAQIEREIEARAEVNGGAISDEDLDLLVQAQTTSLAKLEKLCGYLEYLEAGIQKCKDERERIAGIQERAEHRLKSMKQFLVPYVQDQRERLGHPLAVGTHTLSTRKSTSVAIDDEAFFVANAKSWPELVTEKVVVAPNKTAIKEQLEAGHTIPSCRLQENVSLILK